METDAANSASSGDDTSPEALSKAFEVWLPVILGFVGSTVTYYFTRKK